MNKIITIYELLGLMKDGKAPHSILFKNEVWFWGYDTYTTFECLNKTPDAQISLFSKYRIDYCLNDKVEIIDDAENKSIIEKLKVKDNKVIGKWENGSDYHYTLSAPQVVIINKINEIISYLKDKEEE